jgi:predicted DNA-binding transcriptional regulator AlpA
MSSPLVQDELVPDPQVCKEFGITSMTLWRWDRDDELDFPPPVKIRKKNYRSRQLLEKFKQRMVNNAIAARGR